MTGKIYDFAIVGAGMAGASIAAEVSPHASVIVLEAEDRPGHHATGRSAAFWEECYGGPEIVPLTLASGPFLRENGFLHPRGALYIGRDTDHTLIDAFVRRFEATGATLERVGRDQLSARIPGLKPSWMQGVWEAACADIDVAALHQYYLAGVRKAGAELTTRARLNRAQFDDGIWHLSSERGNNWRARTLVNAAGAWADSVAAMAGIGSLGIQPYRRTVMQLRIEPSVRADLPLCLDISGRFYFKPEQGRLWLSPHDETPSEPCDAAPEEIDVATAIARLEEVVDWRVAAVEHKWAGLRSFSPDRLPVYGPDPANPAFFWFAGQGGYGIQTAPAAARLGAQLLLDQGRDVVTENLAPHLYAPDRFSKSADSEVERNQR